MKRSPRFTQGFTRTLNPKLERFIRVNPTAVELIRKSSHWDPKTASGLNAHRSLREIPKNRRNLQVSFNGNVQLNNGHSILTTGACSRRGDTKGFIKTFSRVDPKRREHAQQKNKTRRNEFYFHANLQSTMDIRFSLPELARAGTIQKGLLRLLAGLT